MSLSERIYSMLLTFVFPREFLREYREPLRQAFRDQLRNAGGSSGGVLKLWANTIVDLAHSAPGAYMDEIRSMGFAAPAAYLVCVTGMVLLGRYELRTDDTGVVVFLVLAMTFALGCMHPKRAWLWAVAPLCVPGADVLWGAAAHINGFILVVFVVTALGFAGSYSGAFVRRLIS